DEDGVRSLVAAVAELSRKKCGATIVIEREYDLEEVIVTGKQLDRIHVDREVIEMMWENKDTSLGAMVIRNSRIICVNSKLPLVTSSQLSRAGAGVREYACLGAVETFEAAAICVNGSTGKISILGRIGGDVSIDLGFELKDMNIESGVSEEAICKRLTMFLLGKKDVKTLEELNNPQPEVDKKKKLTKEERLALREEKKRKRLEEKENKKKAPVGSGKESTGKDDEPVAKGFFG
ncbi:diadenylate cyclase, partial [Bacillus mycoides]|uniref:diadenylate cyclase n=1 Tax=Bacillus mycoides TaxID=1405 RepID=UPI003A80ACFF